MRDNYDLPALNGAGQRMAPMEKTDDSGKIKTLPDESERRWFLLHSALPGAAMIRFCAGLFLSERNVIQSINRNLANPPA